MKLIEKLHAIYEIIDYIDKTGHNKMQNYDYVRSADVTHAIRKAFIAQKIYAEINFDFVGPSYVIAREKAPNAPFSAVNVKCSAIFHDLETGEKATGSGLGSGCDTSDKAAYKAQTGALKYMLKNAFLIPDEADPEADESVDEVPDFQEASRQVARQSQAPRVEKVLENPFEDGTISKPEPVKPPKAVIPEMANVSATASSANPQDASDVPFSGGLPPTDEQIEIFRKKIRALSDELASLPGQDKLKPSKGLPVNRKILGFLLSVENVKTPADLTIGHWEDFFKRAEVVRTRDGLPKLVQLIDAAV